MVQVANIVEPTEPYAVMPSQWQVLRMDTNAIQDIDQIQQQFEQEVTQQNNSFGIEVMKGSIRSDDFYYDEDHQLFMGYTYEEFLQLFVTLKKIKITFTADTSVTEQKVYDWISGKTTIRNWNEQFSYYPIAQNNQILFNEEDEIVTTLPFERCCMADNFLAGHQPNGTDDFESNKFYTASYLVNPTYGRVFKYNKVIDGINTTMFALNLDLGLHLNLNHFGGNSYASARIGARGFRALLSYNQLIQDYYKWTNIPVTFIDGQKIINGSFWMKCSPLDWLKINSWSGSLNIEIIRYQEPDQ